MFRRSACAVLAAAALLSSAAVRSQDASAPIYRDPTRPVDARVADLLGRMTVEEKFWQLFMIPGDLDHPEQDYSHGIFGLQVSPAAGSDAAGTPPGDLARAYAARVNAIQRYFVEHTRLGIPIIPFDEAVHGLARPGATMFPQAIALAATWDPDLMARAAGAIADETRSRGIRQVLSPVVNIASDVRWGRVDETYGEDPYLASAMARAFVGAFAAAGLVATPKHFVANVGEGGRDSYPIDLDERTLRERFFPPFRAAIDAGALSVMAAYNSVDGTPATQNARLLNGILKGEWGFRGFVISDASGTSGATVLHLTEPSTAQAATDAFNAGLDVVFQSSYGQQRPYLDAVERGLIPMPVIDAAVARVLRAKFALGLFEHPYVDPEAAAAANGSAAHHALARRAEDEAIVLLKNDGRTLPLKKSARAIAVIGVDAREARLGGYSGPGAATVSILDGIRSAAGGSTNVRYAPGPGRVDGDLVVVPPTALAPAPGAAPEPAQGLSAAYFDNPRLDGPPRLTRVDPDVDFHWTLSSPGRGVARDWFSARWDGTIVAPPAGVRRIAVEGDDGYRLYLDGQLAIDDWRKQSYGTRAVDVSYARGSSHAVRLEVFETTGGARVRLEWDTGTGDLAEAAIVDAVDAARASDAAVIVAGVEEGEFRDRARLGLPGRQEELIQRVAATGTPVTVVVIGGSAVTMPWLDRVGAVIDAWYPGEAGGAAVADVLFGDVDPAGRLPITFPMAEGQLPLYYDHKPTGRGDDYVDLSGLPLFPFGFGLSYTTFDYSNLLVTPDTMGPDATATVRCTVRNAGTREGDEVVQLYIHDLVASVAQPVIQLEGFRRVHLDPGASTDVTFTLGPSELRLLDRDMKWVVEPGRVAVMIGASSNDIRLRGTLTVLK